MKKGARLTINETSLRFDQQIQRLKKWMKREKKRRKGRSSFEVSSARACPLWEGGLGGSFEVTDGTYSHQHIAMNFLLLLFLVFFAPLLLFASQ